MNALAMCGLILTLGADQPAVSPKADRFDAVLLVDRQPILLRLHVTLDGDSILAARQRFIDDLIKKLDADGDGKLTRLETVQSPYLTTTGVPQGNAGFFDVFRNRQEVPRAQVESSVEGIGGKPVSFRDQAGDAADNAAVFKLIDADNSGTIDAKEMADAAGRLSPRDIDGDECLIPAEFTVDGTDPNMLLQGRQNRNNVSPSSNLVLDIANEAGAGRIIGKYDADKDGHVSAAELGWPADRFAKVDASKDGKLDAKEILKLADGGVDLEVAVKLGKRAAGEPGMAVISSSGTSEAAPKSNDGAPLFRYSHATVSLSFRDVDTMKDAEERVTALHAELDVDKNGYIEVSEIGFRLPQGRLSFAAMDADGDEKLFLDEMKQYAAVRAQSAATSAHIHVIDDGFNFFGALDTNGDGRISAREVKASSATLAGLERDQKPGVSAREPIQNVRLELARGSFDVVQGGFRQFNQPRFSPPRQPPPSAAPLWFQRMDRNQDGDITWKEFLGTRQAFDDLDRDRDGMISPEEAKASEKAPLGQNR